MKWITCEDNKWYTYSWKGNRIKCCDCGVVHHVSFRLLGKRLQIKAKRRIMK